MRRALPAVPPFTQWAAAESCSGAWSVCAIWGSLLYCLRGLPVRAEAPHSAPRAPQCASGQLLVENQPYHPLCFQCCPTAGVSRAHPVSAPVRNTAQRDVCQSLIPLLLQHPHVFPPVMTSKRFFVSCMQCWSCSGLCRIRRIGLLCPHRVNLKS